MPSIAVVDVVSVLCASSVFNKERSLFASATSQVQPDPKLFRALFLKLFSNSSKDISDLTFIFFPL